MFNPVFLIQVGWLARGRHSRPTTTSTLNAGRKNAHKNDLNLHITF